MNEVLIVGQGCQISMITSDRVEAEQMLAIKQKTYPSLNWGIRSIFEAVSGAYQAGQESQETTDDLKGEIISLAEDTDTLDQFGILY